MKKYRIIFNLVSILIIVFMAVSLTCCNENKISEEEIRKEMELFNEDIHNQWKEIRPLTVTNNIVITASDTSELVRYDRKYILLENDTGYLMSNTTYFGNLDYELNNQQEIYFHNDFIHMRYSDSNGEVIKDYESTMEVFEELLNDGANDFFEYNYNYDYFESTEYEYLDDAIKILFKIKDENIPDFLGDEIANLSEMYFTYYMYYTTSKIEVSFEYNVTEEGEISHIYATCVAEENGSIVIPEWAQ